MSKKKKKILTSEQIYKKNRRKSKLFKILAPIVFWTFIVLTIIFVALMIKHSVGNVSEVINLLDKDTHTGQQLEENYAYLVDKYGEWKIVGRSNSVFSVQFINIKAALFSGLMKTYLILSVVCFLIAIIIGKILFPKLSQYLTNNNQDMANIATLRTNDEVMKLKEAQSKEKEKEWF